MGEKSMRALSRLESFPWLHLSQTTPFGSTIGGLPRKPWLPRLSGMTCSTLVNGTSACLQYRQIGKASSHAIEPSLHPEDTSKPGSIHQSAWKHRIPPVRYALHDGEPERGRSEYPPLLQT